MRVKLILASLTLPLVMLDVSSAFAQDATRIVMRRPLQAPASGNGDVSAPATCGGPSNPCPDQCSFTAPSWNHNPSDPNVCVGSDAPANAYCKATDKSGNVIAVPDSVCLEQVSTYTPRCGSFAGMPASGPVAGARPETIPGTQNCTAQGSAVLISVASPRVATGSRASDGTWKIFGFDPSTTASCTYPSAAPATVECRVNGVPKDPSNCSVESYSALYAQNLVPVSPGGVTPSDIRQAQWVRPGFVTSGCTAVWKSVDNPVPAGCGTVTVPVTVTCDAQNPQSGSIPEGELSCNPATKPPTSKTVQDYRACSIAMEAGTWGPFSNTCGSVERTRTDYCRRSDGTALDLASSDCSQLVTDHCNSLSTGRTCGSQTTKALTVKEVAQLQDCAVINSDTYSWKTENWGSWSTTCGSANRSRTVSCIRNDGVISDDNLCNGIIKPASSETSFQTSGCPGPNYCSGSSVITSFSNSSNIDRSSDCSAAGASCMEKSFTSTNGAGAYVSKCYSSPSPVATAANNGASVPVHGTNYTYGSDGWCDYAASPSTNRNCLRSATAITPATLNQCPANAPPVDFDGGRPDPFMDYQCTGGAVAGVDDYISYTQTGQQNTQSASGWRDSCIAAGGTCFQFVYQLSNVNTYQEREESYYYCAKGFAARNNSGEGGSTTITDNGAFNACGTTEPYPQACTTYKSTVTGDTCEGGTLVGTGQYQYNSGAHPGGTGVVTNTGIQTPTACKQAGGNCLQMYRNLHSEYGNWQEDYRQYECYSNTTSISPNGTYDGLPNSTDNDYYEAGYLSCQS